MDTRLSGWVRQARHRAKTRDIYSDLELNDIETILEEHENLCAYCSEAEIETLDHPFPLQESAPNVPANVCPTCRDCKTKKKNNDLVWMYNNEVLSRGKYITILNLMFERRGGDVIKKHVRILTGLDSDD